jgi:hypothetical protein
MQGPLRHLSGARIERTDDLPEYASEIARTQGGGRTAWAARLRYAYEFGGGAWEEDVYVTLVFGQSDGVTIFWWGYGHTMRAPAGLLDRMTPLLAVPVQSLRQTLEWSAMLEHARELYQRNRGERLAEQKRFNEVSMQHRQAMRQAHQQVFEERQAAHARQNFAMREVLGGVQTYVNPFQSSTVELPLGYRRYWVSNNGQIVGSNDEMFDPRSDNAHEWRDMERYKP